MTGKAALETYLRIWHPSARVVTWYTSGPWSASWWHAEVVTNDGQLPAHGSGMTEVEAVESLADGVRRWHRCGAWAERSS